MRTTRQRTAFGRLSRFRMAGIAAVASMLFGLGLMDAPRAEAGSPCPPDSVSSDVTGSSQYLCINGTRKYTRARISIRCFTTVERPNVILPRSACGDLNYRQRERIAQARFIQYLGNSVQPGVAPDVAPNVQWEVNTPRLDGSAGRADVIRYIPNSGNPATSPVEVWEIKGSWNRDDPLEQASEYVQTLQDDAGWGGATLGDASEYTDYFEVENYAQCSDGRWVNGRYSVYQSEPGVIRVDELLPQCADLDQNSGSEGEGEGEQSQPEQVPNPLPVPVPTPNDPPNPPASPPGIPGAEPSHTEVIVIAGVAVTVVVVGTLKIWETLKARSDAVCVELALKFPGGGETTAGMVGERCLALQLAAQQAVGEAEAVAWSKMASELVMMAERGEITIEALATALGITIASAAALVAAAKARAYGDPHLVTLDGLNYDLQAVGEFTLVAVPGAGPVIQSRFIAMSPDFSAVSAIAFEWAESLVELRPDGSVLADGRPLLIRDGEGFSVDGGGYLVRDEGRVLVQWPAPSAGEAGAALVWEPRGGVGFVGVALPPSAAGEAVGLLGDFDGDPLDDLKLRDGTQLPARVTPTVLHDGFADSWRVRAGESFFTYAPGQSSRTFTDLSFPRALVTRGDFSPEERSAAMATCQGFGVPAGPAFDDCELDVLATGNWAFALVASNVRVPSVVAGDATVDAEGLLSEDFEAEIPNNFDAIRTAEEEQLSRFAGPFTGNEQYRFYVPQLPGHDDVTVSFDAIALGEWSATEGIRMKLDDVAVDLPLDWSVAETGTLPSGTQFRRVRATVTLPHHLSQAGITLYGEGLESTSGKGFAIDNIAVNLHLVPAQTFGVELVGGVPVPLDARTGLVGAGLLESRGAVDRYEFSTAVPSELYLDWQVGSSHVAWDLISADGALVASGTAQEGDARVSVGAGTFVIEVSPRGSQPPFSQTYGLELLAVPPVQVFVVGPLASSHPVTVSSGVPGPGAGNVETKASVDEYVFTVPEGGSRVVVDMLSSAMQSCWYGGCSVFGGWSVLAGDGSVVGSGQWSDAGQRRFDQALAAGQYRLRITSESEFTGTYSVRMYLPPAAQAFPVSLSTTTPVVVGNGQPGAGAGKLETWLSRDDYVFTVGAGDALSLDVTGNSTTKLRWRLTDGAGTVVAQDAWATDRTIDGLAAGQYTLSVFIDPASTGVNDATYSAALLRVPTPV